MDKEKPEQQITVEFDKRSKAINVSLPKLTSLVENVCNRFEVHRAEINILIVDDQEITDINKRFLNRKHSTDCISFDLSDTQDIRSFDIVVNAERAVRETGDRGIRAQAELALYITHGLLHNLGFDDNDEASATRMHRVEDEILQEQGFGPVYK